MNTSALSSGLRDSRRFSEKSTIRVEVVGSPLASKVVISSLKTPGLTIVRMTVSRPFIPLYRSSYSDSCIKLPSGPLPTGVFNRSIGVAETIPAQSTGASSESCISAANMLADSPGGRLSPASVIISFQAAKKSSCTEGSI